jgi:hypothetical protein
MKPRALLWLVAMAAPVLTAVALEQGNDPIYRHPAGYFSQQVAPTIPPEAGKVVFGLTPKVNFSYTSSPKSEFKY